MRKFHEYIVSCQGIIHTNRSSYYSDDFRIRYLNVLFTIYDVVYNVNISGTFRKPFKLLCLIVMGLHLQQLYNEQCYYCVRLHAQPHYPNE